MEREVGGGIGMGKTCKLKDISFQCMTKFTTNLKKRRRREVKSKGEKERYLNAEFQRIARRDKKAFLGDQCKDIEENNTMGKTRDLLKNQAWSLVLKLNLLLQRSETLHHSPGRI